MKQPLLYYLRIGYVQKINDMSSENPPNIHAYLFWFFLIVLPILGAVFLF